MKTIIAAVMLLSTVGLFSQELEKKEPKNDKKTRHEFKDVVHNKGRLFFFWGWNRSTYSKSDIKFKGEDYNFTLFNVTAEDKPKPFGIEFLDPGRLTIPQNNYRIGYFFHDHYNVTLGVDHMKYVMRNDQTVKMSGYINDGGPYDGTYQKDNMFLGEDFLTFEHTDGLNYLSLEFNRFDTVDEWIGLRVKHIDINLTEGLGFGLLYPKTNTKLQGKERYDEFHLSGYGLSAHAGINLTFFKWFYLQYTFKAGYINMQDIRTTAYKVDSASQHFTFIQNMWVFGFKINLKKGNY